ncbi:AraC family transcriptional regulator [Gloeocapsopsis sp. IPPAS B-1203]|uniref:AraC family transcriptional regulator n=1 Tax=Gloeocapsopsis sp. IPPAS B-1203 TaxID=2049454 RepID=UPI000C1A0359|nr:AraC family transcriptional regulator [Gloeocapsopsis sp. IPPAS B-1203]PIG93369.1 AraC family transcriptional regulator [Gloeocapsopsis sp. IPPAS B-1203]
MTLILSVPEFLNQQQDNSSQNYEILVHDPAGQSQGYRRSQDLRPGLNLLIDNYTLQENLIVDTRVPNLPNESHCSEFSFMICGNNTNEQVYSGQNFLEVGWSAGGFVEWQAGQQILKLDVHINQPLYDSIVVDLAERSVSISRAIAQQQSYFQVNTTTPTMQVVLHQIFNCPYQGLTRAIYLESKVLELVALRLEQAIADNTKSDCKRLNPDDIERIYHAKDILLNHADNPPSLVNLARQVGLNDYKLKLGFRQLFGTTAFGYLHSYRMEQARSLLECNQLSVKEIGQKVGYTNSRRFAIAFKQRFGVSPQAYRTGKR